MFTSQPKLYELASNFKNLWLFKCFWQYYSRHQKGRSRWEMRFGGLNYIVVIFYWDSTYFPSLWDSFWSCKTVDLNLNILKNLVKSIILVIMLGPKVVACFGGVKHQIWNSFCMLDHGLVLLSLEVQALLEWISILISLAKCCNIL